MVNQISFSRSLTVDHKQHYNDHMIVSVRESKARMSELLNKACKGEDVVISVRGQPKARLVPLADTFQAPDMQAWAGEIKKRLTTQDARSQAGSTQEIMDDLRSERW